MNDDQQKQNGPGAFYCPECRVAVARPLVCKDCLAVLCRECGSVLERADELGIG